MGKIAKMIQYLSKQLLALVAESNRKCINEWSPCSRKHDDPAGAAKKRASAAACLPGPLERESTTFSSIPSRRSTASSDQLVLRIDSLDTCTSSPTSTADLCTSLERKQAAQAGNVSTVAGHRASLADDSREFTEI